MKNQYITIISLLILLFLLFPSNGYTGSLWTFDLDFKYEHSDKTQGDIKDKIEESRQEFLANYQIPVSSETRLESEFFASLQHEDNEQISETGRIDSQKKNLEHHETFRIKSHLYELRAGYKQFEEKQSLDSTDTTGFIDLHFQPDHLPEFNCKYDFEKTIDPNSPEKIAHILSLNSDYNLGKYFKVRLQYQGDIDDYKNKKQVNGEGLDSKKGNLMAQLTFIKYFLLHDKLRLGFDYKYEKQKEKEIDPNDSESWLWQHDNYILTTISKITYSLSPDTIINTHYENKSLRDEFAEDEQKNTVWVDMSQKIWSYTKLNGKYKYETNNKTSEDTQNDTYEIETLFNPREWLNLQGRYKLDTFKTDSINATAYDQNNKNRSVEGIWKAHFPNIFDAQNTFSAQYSKEEDIENNNDPNNLDFLKEMNYKWKIQLEPFHNFTLTPEYNLSKEEQVNLGELCKETINEEKVALSYKITFTERLKIDLSQTFGRKKTSNENINEKNDDTKLSIKYLPFPNIILTSQVIREDKKIFLNNHLDRDELDISYNFNFDCHLKPFLWSGSYKYDDLNHQNDTETVESKLSYKFTAYEVSLNYRFSKIYSIDYDQEQRLGFQLSARY